MRSSLFGSGREDRTDEPEFSRSFRNRTPVENDEMDTDSEDDEMAISISHTISNSPRELEYSQAQNHLLRDRLVRSGEFSKPSVPSDNSILMKSGFLTVIIQQASDLDPSLVCACYAINLGMIISLALIMYFTLHSLFIQFHSFSYTDTQCQC